MTWNENAVPNCSIINYNWLQRIWMTKNKEMTNLSQKNCDSIIIPSKNVNLKISQQRKLSKRNGNDLLPPWQNAPPPGPCCQIVQPLSMHPAIHNESFALPRVLLRRKTKIPSKRTSTYKYVFSAAWNSARSKLYFQPLFLFHVFSQSEGSKNTPVNLRLDVLGDILHIRFQCGGCPTCHLIFTKWSDCFYW